MTVDGAILGIWGFVLDGAHEQHIILAMLILIYMRSMINY